MTRYTNRHVSQYGPWSTVTRQSGCTWTSGSNGIDAQSGGKVTKNPDQVKAQVKPEDETNPNTPGWSMVDLSRAMAKLGVPFDDRTGLGWGAVRSAHDAGLYIVLQGDSDRFADSTCSGAFNGDHAIGVHPNEDGTGRWRIDDPICPVHRYETEATLRAYAEKLSAGIWFGVFTKPVPVLLPDTSTEDAMLLTDVKALTGTATMTATWGLWDTATDVKSAPVAKGTTFEVLGSVTYHKSKKAPAGFTGYLVNHKARLHVLPSKDVSTFKPRPGDPVSYKVLVGGKAAGSVTLP